MGLLDIFKKKEKIVEGISQDKAIVESYQKMFSDNFQVNGFFAGIGAAPTKNTEQLLDAYNKSPRVKGAVWKIAEIFASVPWKVGYYTNQEGKPKEAPAIATKGGFDVRQKAIQSAGKEGYFKELDNHPILDAIQGGNTYQTGVEMLSVTSVLWDLPGELGYWLKRISKNSPPNEILVIPPQWITLPDRVGGNYKIKWGKEIVDVPSNDFIYFKDANPLNPYSRGSGIGQSLADEIDTDEYASKLMKNALFNNAVPKGFLGAEGASQTGIDILQEEFEQQHRGLNKVGRLHFHTGKINFTKVSQSFEELQLLELRKEEAKIISETYGIPPELLGRIDNSNRSTIDAAMYIMMIGVIVPRLDKYRAFLQRYLVPQFDERLVLDFANPIPEDKQYKLEVIKTVPYMFTRGEIRTLAGAEDRGDIDNIHLMPLSLYAVKPAEEIAPPMLAAPAQEKKSLIAHKAPAIQTAITKSAEAIINEALSGVDVVILQSRLNPLWKDKYEKWGKKVFTELGASGNFNIMNPRIIEFLDKYNFLIKEFNSYTQKVLANSLMEGFALGEGKEELRKRVIATFNDGNMDINTIRSWRITQTEVNRAVGNANYESFLQSGIVKSRQWVAELINSREWHEELHGTVKDMGAPFITSLGNSGFSPGDFAVGEEDINCYCDIIAVVDKPMNLEQLEIVQKDVVRKRNSWYWDGLRTLKEGFKEQERAALSAIK